jgi:hypothetical protein
MMFPNIAIAFHTAFDPPPPSSITRTTSSFDTPTSENNIVSVPTLASTRFAMAPSESITHIVLFKYRENISWVEFENHFESFMSLKQTSLHPVSRRPLVQSLKAGKNRSWEAFSKGMTHGFVLEFACQEDLDYYLTAEPAHLQFSKDAKPLIEDSVVIDIKDGVLFGPKAEHPFAKGEGIWRGACHCQSVRWTARLESAEHVLCHCSTCQKLGGGPYSCNQIIHKDALRIIEGQDNVREYQYKGASGTLQSLRP